MDTTSPKKAKMKLPTFAPVIDIGDAPLPILTYDRKSISRNGRSENSSSQEKSTNSRLPGLSQSMSSMNSTSSSQRTPLLPKTPHVLPLKLQGVKIRQMNAARPTTVLASVELSDVQLTIRQEDLAVGTTEWIHYAGAGPRRSKVIKTTYEHVTVCVEHEIVEPSGFTMRLESPVPLTTMSSTSISGDGTALSTAAPASLMLDITGVTWDEVKLASQIIQARMMW